MYCSDVPKCVSVSLLFGPKRLQFCQSNAMISNLYIVKDYPLYGVGLVRAFTVESLLLNILSSCCFVVKMGGLAGISCRSFLICTRVRDSFDHLERSYGNIYR